MVGTFRQRVSHLVVTSTAACLSSLAVGASLNSFQLNTLTATDRPITEDMNGDGLLDLIVPRYDRKTGRELHVHLQRDGVTFEKIPLRVEVKPEIVAFSIADVRADPGKELLWITPAAVYSYSTTLSGYINNVEHLVDWPLFIESADPRKLVHHPLVDINGDGRDDLILPGNGTYGTFIHTVEGTFKPGGVLHLAEPTARDKQPTIRETRVDTKIGITADDSSVTMAGNIGVHSQYSGWLIPLLSIGRTILPARTMWQTAVQFGNLAANSRRDFFYHRSGRILAHRQQEDGTFRDRPDLELDLTTINALFQRRTFFGEVARDIHLVDIDGDDDTDILVLRPEFRITVIYLFENTSGTFHLQQPSQVFRIKGNRVTVRFVNLPGYTQPFMFVNLFDVPLARVLTNVQVQRKLLIYSPSTEPEVILNPTPLTKWEETFRTDSFKNILATSLTYDVDQDSRADLVSVNNAGEITARRFDNSLQVLREPIWRYAPEEVITDFHFVDLNNDARTDSVIYHRDSSLYLLSTPN